MARPIFLVAVCLLVVFSDSPTACQAPVAQFSDLTPEQQAKLKERSRLERIATKLQNAGEFAEARALLVRGMALEIEVWGEIHPETAGSLDALTRLCLWTEDFPAALDYGRRAWETRKALHGENHWLTTDARLALDDVKLRARLSRTQRSQLLEANVLWWQARQAHFGGEYRKARELAEKGLAIRRDILGAKHPFYALSLNNVGFLYSQQSLYSMAAPLYKEALAIRKEVLGEKHPSYTVSLNNLAFLYEAQGLVVKAEPLYKESLAIRKEVLGEKDPDYAVSLNNLAALYADQQLYEKAEPLYKEALAIRKETLGEKHQDYANSLNNLGFLYSESKKFELAESLYEQSLAIREEILNEKHPDLASSLHNLGTLYSKRSRFDKAEPFLMRALALRKEIVGETHPDYALTLNSLASVYRVAGQYGKAERLFKQALAIHQEKLGESHPSCAFCLNSLGDFYKSRGAFPEAREMFLEAIHIMEDHLAQTASVRSEADQLTHTAGTRVYLNNLLTLPNTDASEVYAIAFRWRGAVTAHQTLIRAARAGNPAVRQTLEDLRDVARRLSNLAGNPPKPGPGVDVPKQMKMLKEERERLEEKLATLSDDLAKYRESRNLKVADIQKLLPADSVLVDFLVYEGQIAAFVINSKSITRVNLKSRASDIAEMVNDFRSLSSLKRTRPVQGAEDQSLLREAVWQPLEPHLKGVNTVLICPDGPLCRLPFAALRGNDPKKYLIEEVAIAVIPVPRLIPDLLAARAPASSSLLLVGDVDFSSNPSGGKATGSEQPTAPSAPLSWRALPGTAGEIRKIEELFRKNVPGSVVRSFTKGEATEAAISTAAGKHRYLHFATHGFFDDPKPTGQAISAEDRSGAGRGRRTSPNPALLCGLVCAGANRPTADDDGVLTALEIADLDLGGVELAVLSACETGLGQVAGGDGVLGLQRAFQLAGARTTVTSLWQVPDEATESLMTRFYMNRLKQGMPALKALREAQLWLLNDGVDAGVLKEPLRNGRRTPPLFWAAFVLAGDWR
ncbi:MAG: CHAT domain-containing tetratricopeptide repeat protein [Gemmataceae bacterium]